MYIVTGLGRSGTSFVAQILNSCGLFMGQYFNDEVNAGFEHPDVVRLNKKILKGDFWGHTSETEEIIRVARTVRAAKDPRFVITLGNWVRAGASIEGVFLCRREIGEILQSSEISNAGTMSLFNGFPAAVRSDLARAILAAFEDLCREHGIPVYPIQYPQSVQRFEEIESLSLIVADKGQLRSAWETSRNRGQGAAAAAGAQEVAAASGPRPVPKISRTLHQTSLQSLSDYDLLRERALTSPEVQWREFEARHHNRQEPFTLEGYCWLCKSKTEFAVDFQSRKNKTGAPAINWRERMVCAKCGLNSRKRSTLHLFHHLAAPSADSRIYIAEQLSPIYRWLKKAHPNTVGSEYLGAQEEPGKVNAQGVRHEDLTGLTFADGVFDYVLALDVLEHIPDYRAALSECRRILKDTGTLFITVPFAKRAASNIVRARIDDQGQIEHLMPPDYHGNPLDPQGSLAFYTFGWELLDQLRDLGFAEVKAHLYWSKDFGYLGDNLFVFTAQVQKQAQTTIRSAPSRVPDANHACDQKSLTLVKRPIFIVGCPRSGTTILAKSLGQHSRLWVSTESDFIHYMMDHLRATYEFGTKRKRIWLSSEKVRREEFYAHIGYGINALFADRSSGRRWIDHSNSSTYCIDEIATMFPEAQFLHIVRDGRDTINSMIHFKPRQPWAVDFTTACRNWNLFVTKGQSFQQRHPDRLLQISYETLCMDSESEFKKICHFLGIPFEQEVADFMQTGRLNSSFAQQDRQRLRWQESWQPEEHAIFRQHCGALMTQLGYDVDENPSGADRRAPSHRLAAGPPPNAKAAAIACSIVIPVYNKLEYTRKCIESLLAHQTRHRFEIVIVDNASSDGTDAYLRRLSHQVQVITNTTNVGYTLACNQGAKIAAGEFVCFLNNDTEVRPGWLDALLETFDLYPRAGVVGSKLIYPDGRLQEAGGIVFNDGSGWNYGRFGDPAAPAYRYVREVDYVSGASLMIRHALLESLDYFDERYAPGYYEDTDLCFAARALGHLVLYCPFSQVIHHEGISSGTDLKQGMKRHQVVNQAKFIQKWSKALVDQHAASPQNVPKASERNTKGSILIIDPFLPMFDRASGSLRLFTIVKLLKNKGYHVTYVARNGQGQAAYAELLEKMGVEVFATDPVMLRRMGFNAPGADIDFKRLFSERNFAFVYISFYSLALQYLPIVRMLAPETKIVVDSVDIHFLREQRQAELNDDRQALQRSHETRTHELYIYSQADAVVTVTEDDWHQIAADLPGKPHFVIPNIHVIPEAVDDLAHRSGLLFIGNFNHPPNIDAVQYFVRQVLPLVRASIPDTTLTVVGNNPPKEIEALKAQGIQVTGYVPSTAPYLNQARVSVAPLRYGAGMKGKIGEAMSHGLPVVTTRIGAEGMGLTHGENAFVADDPHELARHIVALCSDDALWRRMAASSRHFIAAHFSPEVAGGLLDRMIASLATIPVLPVDQRRPLFTERRSGKKDLVSIVILTWNQLSYTRQCVKSIQQHTKGKYEIIFVDNGSTDGTVAWLKNLVKRHSDITLIENRKNKGFSKGCNQGIQSAAGEYILLLNNDVVVTPGWLSGMLAHLQRSPEVGIVGPMTNNISGPQQLADVAYRAMKDLPSFARRFRMEHHHRRIPQQRIVGFCMLFRRTLIEDIGLLDENFGTGNFEDDDLCLRAALFGYQNLIAGDVFVHHYGSRSFIGNKVDYKRSIAGNRNRFMSKWSAISPQSLLGKKLMALNTIHAARQLYAKGESEPCLKLLFEGLKVAFEERSLTHELAHRLIDLNQYREARELLEALPPDETDAIYLALLGRCLDGMGMIEDASRVAEQLYQVDGAQAQGLNLKGIMAYRRNMLPQAKDYFEQAISADQGYGEPHANLGILAWEAGRHDEALAYFERGFMLSPDDAAHAVLYHGAATQCAQFDRAAQFFGEARVLYPTNKQIVYLYIDSLIKWEKFAAAVDQIEKALIEFGIDKDSLAAGLAIRRKIGPYAAKPVGKNVPRISLCLSGRDCESLIGQTILRFKPFISEAIYVDTGSGDQSRQIAELFGAHVHEAPQTTDGAIEPFPFTNAAGEWIFVVEPGEMVAEEEMRQLLSLLPQDPKASAYALRIGVDSGAPHAGNPGANHKAGPRRKSAKCGREGRQVRIFPNTAKFHAAMRFAAEGGPAAPRSDLPQRDLDLVIQHVGDVPQSNAAAEIDPHPADGSTTTRVLPSVGQAGLQKENDVLSDAGALYAQEDYQAAIDLLRQAIDHNPDNWVAYYWLFNAMTQAGLNDDLSNLLMAVEKADNQLQPATMAIVGHGYEALGRLPQAARWAEEALGRDRNCHLGWNLKGVLAYHQGDLNHADDCFRKAIAIDHNWGDAWTNRGTVLWDQGETAEALDCFEKGFRLSPTAPNVAAIYHLAVGQLDQYERARPHFEAMRQEQPHFIKGHFLYIDLLTRLQDYQNAMTEVQGLILRFGADPQLLASAIAVRRKIGPLTVSTGKTPSLSLCMIVRNEARHIARCLNSLQPLVDEMIVVDTGSTDATRQIAEVFGANTYDFEWCNDFAAARNFSLSKASGDWILVMDADEVVSPADYECLQQLLHRHQAQNAAFSITTRNYTHLNNLIGWTANDGRYPVEEAGIGWTPSEKVRLFRNLPEIRFEYPVHEVVRPALERAKIKTLKCPVPVHHYGYLDQVKAAGKGEHYYQIGLQKLNEMQHDPQAIRELAVQSELLGRHAEAAALWQRLLAIEPDDPKAHINLAAAHAKLGDYHQARLSARQAVKLAPGLKEARLNLALGELHLGCASEAAAVLGEVTQKWPDYHSARFVRGCAQICHGQNEKGIASIRKLQSTALWAGIAHAFREMADRLTAAGQNQYAARIEAACAQIGIHDATVSETSALERNTLHGANAG